VRGKREGGRGGGGGGGGGGREREKEKEREREPGKPTAEGRGAACAGPPLYRPCASSILALALPPVESVGDSAAASTYIFTCVNALVRVGAALACWHVWGRGGKRGGKDQ